MKLVIVRALGTFLLALCLFAVNAGELVVTDPWIRSAPPNAPALGAFMVLENNSDAEVSVVSAYTSLAVDRVELHRTRMADGVMKMVPQKSIPVPAHSSTVLKPGSWHVMLIGPQKVPVVGEVVQLTLIFDDGSKQVVAATVRQGGKMMGEHAHDE
ncbi:MAG: copper chaperone PCu(A)C [Gammaproteobacteria bacterium]|nr:copper chaperone PCu(A)C [Gammaproteobacteria bacterium]